MSYFQDQDFQERMIALLCRDQKFCKRTSGLLREEDFETTRGQGTSAWVRQEIAKIALNYYRSFRTPIGGMLRYEVLDLLRENPTWNGDSKTRFLRLVERIGTEEELWTSVDSVEEKIIQYKQRKQFRWAIEEMIRKQERGELGLREWQEINRKALKDIDYKVDVREWGTERALEKRIVARVRNQQTNIPYFQIRPLDDTVDMAPRGQLNVILAKYGVGKSNFIAHLAKATAMQGFNVLLYTLEDPMEMFEARLDAMISNIQISELVYQPDVLKKKFKKQLEKLRGRIKIVGAMGGGWTVERMEQWWETERNRGFSTDMVLIDYDKKIQHTGKYSGDSVAMQASTENYLALSNWCQRADIFMWVAAQARRGQKGQKQSIVTGDDAAEDINKLREAGFCLGLGYGQDTLAMPGPKLNNMRFIYVAKNRFGRAEIGWPIMTDFSRSIFYLEDETNSLVTEYEDQVGRKSTQKLKGI